MAALVVTLGSFTFGTTDGDGDRFVLTDIVGWTGIPVELVTVDKPTAAGAVVVYGRYQARALTLVGFGISSTAGHLWRMRNKLEAAVTPTADATLTVQESAGNKALTVRLADTLRVRQRGPRVVEFEVPLLAANPVKV
jgi:hypothetical protein